MENVGRQPVVVSARGVGALHGGRPQTACCPHPQSCPRQTAFSLLPAPALWLRGVFQGRGRLWPRPLPSAGGLTAAGCAVQGCLRAGTGREQPRGGAVDGVVAG